MRDYSEFTQFIIEKTKLNKPLLVERDILLHSLLYRLVRDDLFRKKYLFKGGSCLVKCYFGYYRFSMDLDFTYTCQDRWEKFSKSKKRRKLVSEAEWLAELIEKTSGDLGLSFVAEIRNRRFVEFGSGSRLVTFKLYYRGELLKIQANLVETLLFKPQRCMVRTLIDRGSITDREKAYFKEFLEEYTGFMVPAYDLREILCEKVRAILTRRTQKLRDFYDLYMLERRGLEIENYVEEIVHKIRPMLRYKRYREALEKNRRELKASLRIMSNNYELSLFVKRLDKENFRDFLSKTGRKLREIINYI